MGNWEPLFYTIALLFVFGIVVNLVVEPFIDVSVPDGTSFFVTSGLYGFMADTLNGNFLDFISLSFGIIGNIPILGSFFNFLGFGDVSLTIPIPFINFFALLPPGATTFITEQLVLLTYIPNMILIPFAVLGSLGVIWGVVKLILA